MKTLLISGNTLQEWNLEDILLPEKTNDFLIERMLREENDNTIGRYCDGMTYLEIQQLDNQFNNFR
jgi:hypothetical protein